MSNFDVISICLTVILLALLAIAAFGIYLLCRRAEHQVIAATTSDTALSDAPLRTARRVTVHTKQPDDLTVHGVVVGDYRDRLVLEHAVLIGPDGNEHPMVGAQHFLTSEISWVDVHQLVSDGTGARAREADAITEG